MEQGINGRAASGVGGVPGSRPALNSKKLLLGGIALAAAVIGLISISLSGGSAVKTIPFANLAATKGESVQVYGVLDKQSIRSIRGANLVAFDMVEEKTNARLSVVYDNPSSGLPANFPNASHALATGFFDPVKRKFVTTSVMTKCPSKYKEQNLDPETFNALNKWQQSTGLKPALP